jgi:asparagine synthetase B (glutamine-hydrolysing)
MTIRSDLIAERSTPAESPIDDWVLPISIDDPTRPLIPDARWTQRGQVRVFFRGALFDRDALRALAELPPNCSDADLVLRAYELWGDGALSRLRGRFAVAILDRAKRTAQIARDPLGLHPLFYIERGSNAHFAASPLVLLDLPGAPRSLNRAALADHICNRWPDPNETFFAAVHRAPLGFRVVVSGGSLRLERYWNPLPEDGEVDWLTADETAQFDHLLERAIDRCLDYGATGIFLSGGLDSVSVAAMANDRARRKGSSPPLALSLAFPDPECDERERQAAVARRLGLPQHLIPIDEAIGSPSLLEQSLALNRRLSAPLVNAWMPAFLALAQRGRRDGIRTILTGQGGDEWLTVSPYLSADLIGRGAFLELARFYLNCRRSYRLGPLALANTLAWKFGLRPLAGSIVRRFMPNAFNARRLRGSLDYDPLWIAPDPELRLDQARRAEAALLKTNWSGEFYLREIRAGLDHTLTSWEAEEHYEAGKLIDIRFLHPFWDPDLVQMLCRVPPHLLNEGGASKGLVRKVLARRFPELGFERQRKVAATSYFQTLLTESGPALADAAGQFPALSTLGVVDGRAAREFVVAGLRQRGPHNSRVFQMINLEMWARPHVS